MTGKMKISEVLAIAISVIIMVLCGIFLLNSLGGGNKGTKSEEPEEKAIPLKTEIDQDTLKKLKEFESYKIQEIVPSNLGKSNIFKEE